MHMQLKENDKIVTLNNSQSLPRSFFEGVDLVLFSRECPFDFNQLLELRNEIGFKLIVDVDDYWNLYPNHILYNHWKATGTTEQIIKSITKADFITTTHEYLRDKLVRLVKDTPIEILPNALPYGEGQFTDNKEQTNNIVYSCGITHLQDIRVLRRFFELCSQSEIVQKYKLCVAGFNEVNSTSKEMWLKIESEGKRFGNYARWKSLPLTEYMNHYKHASICIAPLEDNEFNRNKSCLKILEAGCKNIPILASDLHPYVEMPGLLLCKTQRDWYNNLNMLIKNPEKIIEHGNTLGAYVKENFHLSKVNEKRKKLYDQWGTN